MKKYLFILAFFFSANTVMFGQGDQPCAAASLTPAASCTFTGGTTVPLAYQNNAANGGTPTCASPGAPDGWYSFVAPAGGNVTITTQAGTMTDGALALYSATSCGVAMTELACNDDFIGLMPQISATGLVPGNTYYVRVWSYGSGTGTFGICITLPAGAPANDDPCNAAPLTVSGTCTYSTYTNASATASTGVPAPGCASYSGGDVWFSVSVPASGSVTFDTQTGVITDGGMAVYSGSCGALSLVACDDDSSPNGLMSMLAITGQTPGATLWIRIWEYGNNNNGTFGICATDPGAAGTSSQNCNGAIPICSDASFAGNSNGFDVQELGVANQGCLIGNEHQTTWFGFSPQLVGTIQLTISPTIGLVDYDFAIWGPYPPGTGCPVTGAPLRCSFSAVTGPTGLLTGQGDVTEGAGGNSWVDPIVVGGAQIGQVYYLVVDNFTANTTPFTLDWTLSTPGMLDCTPPLPVELANFGGYPSGSVNHLNWSTTTEINSDHFIVEKSIDAQSFTEFTRIDGAGNSNSLLAYSSLDENPYATTYYRLKQVDLNGDFKYFGPIMITNNEVAEFVVQSIYPTPADHSFFINMFSKNESNIEIQIFDSFGKMVSSQASLIHGQNTIEIQSIEWSSGLYIVKIIDEKQQLISINKMMIE